jgi:tetratricopeptide (TPR) repeat protein
MSLDKARQQHAAEDYKQAIETYQTVLDQTADEKEQAKIYLELAWVYYKIKQFEEAITSINAVMRLDPDFEEKAEIFRIKAFSYIALNELELAEKFLEKSLNLDRSSEKQQIVIFELGKIYFKKQEYDQALKQLNDVDSYFFQNNQEYWRTVTFFKGFCHYYLKQFEQSEKNFEELLENSEDQKSKANALYGLAYLSFEMKDYLKTINLCEAVITNDPDFFDLETVGFMVSTSFHYLGRDDVFKEYAEKMVQQYPDGRYTSEIQKLLSLQKNSPRN